MFVYVCLFVYLRRYEKISKLLHLTFLWSHQRQKVLFELKCLRLTGRKSRNVHPRRLDPFVLPGVEPPDDGGGDGGGGGVAAVVVVVPCAP